MEFGKRLRIKRLAMGLTLTQLGEMVGCSHSAISNIETGKSNGGRGVATKLKKAMKLRGGASVDKAPKKARKARREAVGAGSPIAHGLLPLTDAINALVKKLGDVEAVLIAAHLAPFAPEKTALVPPVAVQRATTEAMTKGIARNGLRKPLASNSLDPVIGARLMPITLGGA